MVSDEYDHLFKIICVGGENTGKTDSVIQFSQGFFQEEDKLEIGVEFSVKTVELFNDQIVKLLIWDTGGQERFQYVRPMYYRGAEGALIFFNILNRDSFRHVPKWIEEINSNVGDIPILIVGNFLAEESTREVLRKEAEVLALGSQAYYMESCVNDLTAINNIFYSLSCMMIGIDVPDQYLSYRRNMSDQHLQELKEKREEEEEQKRNEERRRIELEKEEQIIKLEKEEERRIRELKEENIRKNVIVKKIKKMMNVSTRIRLDMMRETIQMDFKEFNKNIWDWAKEFNFIIDGDYIVVENADINGFINILDDQFEHWSKSKKKVV